MIALALLAILSGVDSDLSDPVPRQDRTSAYPRVDRRDRIGSGDPTLLRVLASSTLPGVTGGCDGAAIFGGRGEVVTFTRASSASCTKGDGTLVTLTTNQPRVSSLGLNIEGSGTNLALRSQEFDNASWAKGGTTITADSTVAPDGTTTADTDTAIAGSQLHRVVTGNNIAYTNGSTYTASVYVYSATAAFIGLQYNDTGLAAVCQFRTSNWTVDPLCSGGTTGTVTTFTNGWHRLSMTKTASATTAGGNMTVVLCDVAANCGSTWPAVGTETAIIWGAQLEQSAFATSYIPTTTTSATRAIDVASVAQPSAWGDTAGCMAASYRVATVTASARVLGVGATNRIALSTTTDAVTNDGTNTVTAVAGSTIVGRTVDDKATWTGSTLALTHDAVSASGTYAGAMVGATIYLGSDGTANALGGYLSNVRLGGSTTACDR